MSRSHFATVLADISNLNIKSEEVMNKTILEKILGMILISFAVIIIILQRKVTVHSLHCRPGKGG